MGDTKCALNVSKSNCNSYVAGKVFCVKLPPVLYATWVRKRLGLTLRWMSQRGSFWNALEEKRVTFIGSDKAFDIPDGTILYTRSLNINIVIQTTIQYLYNGTQIATNNHRIPQQICIKRGVRQGRSISRSSLIFCREENWKQLVSSAFKISQDWHLNVLLFADNVIWIQNK